MPTERRRLRSACADRAVDTRERRVVCAVVCRVTSPRLLLSSSLVASPARLCQSRRRRRRASAEPRASRRADRAPPTSSCVRRSCRRHTRAPCRVRRRVSSDITAPPALLVASPARLCQSRRRRRRASAEPRASRRADRAPPTSSCVRRSCRRHTRAPCRVRRRVSSDITAPPALLVARRIAGSALSEPTPATPSERRAASESSCRPSAADLVVRTPIVPSTHARAVSCAPSCVERPTTPMTRRRGGRRGALHCKITGVPRPR